jgi:hypothetical protein
MNAPQIVRRRTAACFLSVMAASPVAAGGPQFSLEGGWSFIGGYFTLNDYAPAVFGEAVFGEHPIGSSSLTYALDLTGGWIDGRDIAYFNQFRYKSQDHIWMLAGGLRFHYGAENAWYRPLFFSLQPSLHTGRTQALSSSYEFTLTLGWQAEHWMMALRHSSNAFLHMPNRGENMVLFGITF